MSHSALLDLPRLRMSSQDHEDPELFVELLAAVEEVGRSGRFILGAEVERFEAAFAAYCGTAHAVGVSSGTEALALALRAAGVRPGDEVIVPAWTFVATAEAVSHIGGRVRFADVDPHSGLLTGELVEQAMTPRTRAVIPVHLHGRTVDLEPIMALAAEHALEVVEDAAQAHGAWVGGRRAGAVGRCGCFSFYPAKNLGAWGDGGAVTTDDPGLAKQLRLLRSHGEQPRYHHRLVGTTARLDALQAAILRIKLRRLEGWNGRRRALAAALSEGLRDTSVDLPPPPAPTGDHVFHQFVVRTPARDALRDHLERAGIETGVHYPVPLHRCDAYADGRSLPGAQALADTALSLPVHPGLADSDVDRVVDAVRTFDAGGGR